MTRFAFNFTKFSLLPISSSFLEIRYGLNFSPESFRKLVKMQNGIRSSAEELILERLTRISSSFTAESETAVCRGRRSDRRSVSPWSNGGGCLDIGSAGNLLGDGEGGGGRVFAKEGERGEEAENRIDMRPMREREKGKGEGTLGGRKGTERKRKRGDGERERERSSSRKGNAEGRTRSWKWGELASLEGEKGAGKGGEGRQLQARSSVASGARERESAVGRGGREQCHGGQCLAGGCPSTCSLASLPDSAPQCFQSRVHRWVEPRSSSELLKLATLGSHHHIADKKWNRIRDPVDRPRNPSRLSLIHI